MNAFRVGATASLLAIGVVVRAAPTLTTDEKRYDAGAPVVFTVENDSPDVLAWGSFGRHPVVYRKLSDGEREVVYGLPDAMDEGAVMLAAGNTSQWVWNQARRGDGEPGDDGDGADNADQGIAVGEPNPNGDPSPTPTPMNGAGDRVRAGKYVAEFDTFDEVYATPEFEIRAALAVDPGGKAAVTWAALKSRR